MISARKTKHLDVKTIFTYSHANTPLGQSERAYYLSYFIIVNRLILSEIMYAVKKDILGLPRYNDIFGYFTAHIVISRVSI